MSEEIKNNADDAENKKATIGLVIGVIAFLAIFVGIIWFLLLDSTPTERIRDITIIFLGIEGILIGLATTILIVQVAKLVNMIQNEVNPLLESANETINTVKGTAEFLSDALVEPVLKVSGFLSIFKRGIKAVDGFFETINTRK